MSASNFECVIKTISDEFIQEAVKSPILLADMAAMENYMAESYSGRIFIELLQNADDCGSKKMILKQVNNNIYFANDGRPFNEQDIISICRSGASSKQRGENIGYRGIGFKSSTYLSDEIIIFSNETSFTFSKKLGADFLGISEKSMPTVRIPFFIENVESSILNEIDILKKEGFSTVFVFKNARVEKIIKELESIDADYFIFLNNILMCSVDTNQFKKTLTFKRECFENGFDFIENADDTKFWRVFKAEKSALAFKVHNGKIIECNNREAIYHSFLPTNDKTPYRLKINSDFSTDPSRKHLTDDEFTNVALASSSTQIYDLIQNIFFGNVQLDSPDFLSIFINQQSFSSINTSFVSNLKNKFKTLNLLLSNGERIPIKKYKIFPSWIDKSEIAVIRKNSVYAQKCSLPLYLYDTYFEIDEFIANYSTEIFSIEDICEMLNEERLKNSINLETYGKLIINIIKKTKIKNEIGDENNNGDIKRVLQQAFGNEDKNVIQLKDIVSGQLSDNEIDWLSKNTRIELNKRKKETQNFLDKQIIVQRNCVPLVSKWRSAEQQVIQIEEFFGNTVIDVSKKNIGYDLEVTKPDGTKKYIEVKLLQNDNSEFCITNNEYTSAHQLNANYYICLLSKDKITYIKDPLKNLIFEKRVRQWEWLCEEYSGEEYKINFK